MTLDLGRRRAYTGLRMEGQLLKWVMGRLARQPLAWVLWLVLVALAWGLPRLGELGPRTELFSLQAVTLEAAFLWTLCGGVIGLAACAEIAPWVDPLAAMRRWRARVICLALPLFAPTIPMLAQLARAEPAPGAPIALAVAAAGLQLLALALVCDRIPGHSVRSFAFLGFAWWVPALVPSVSTVWEFHSPRGAGFPELSTALSSGAWQTGFGSILATLLLAAGLDLMRRPAP